MSPAQSGTSAAAKPVNGRAFPPRTAVAPVNLADHFLECCKLNRYLTVADGHRFVITEDFERNAAIPADAAAMAAIYSRDKLVAQAAILPLGQHAKKLRARRDRDAYERLFQLIEEQALDDRVRDNARALLERGFREAEIRSLEAELNDQLSPARARYRQFLEVVRRMMDGAMTPPAFVEEFKAFTADVAGRLDFGIYSFCLDRLFGSLRIPTAVKQLLVGELLAFPPLVRRELLTNILVFPGQTEDLKRFVRNTVLAELGRSVAVEVELLEAYKLRRITLDDLAGAA
ncbi:MAG: hypothetical protein COW30_09105 [Rhodospirillales bacterium CG15_BIG_FIL_POST_REV_8_21_14_020_66_15]|nr:MAG: hypothetical protein COW30_09105 [Rhodospirillales bacterium CG15_BIG_FIL_POST_REV_8_21_14_020_66_15]